MLALEPCQTVSFLVWLAAIHDIGKFARAFQCKVPELWAEREAGKVFRQGTRHDADGRTLWDKWLDDTNVIKRIWPGAKAEALETLIGASLCHHGEPAQPSRTCLKYEFGPGAEAAAACRDVLLDLLLPRPIEAPGPSWSQAAKASHWVAGLVTVADWLGSSQRWFPYAWPDSSPRSYWEKAREKAARAVREAGLCPARPCRAPSFADLTGKTGEPTPLQDWALSVPLPPGPLLFILEDVTGAGKTEAAHVLVHRLMADGRASGAWWAMPTMATANAMYARQANMLAGLFDADGIRPSLALAHGQARLHEAFQASRTDWGARDKPLSDEADGLTASAACAAFLADDRRLSLLADIGAGTIDQAVLAVLPARFNTVRLLGLAEKVLVVDEAHAHDAYVTEELLRLLEFHRAQGGSAIVLSATLTNRQREMLVRKWQGVPRGKPLAGWDAKEARYPLATLASPEQLLAQEIAPAPWSRRTTPVERIEAPEVELERLIATLEAGGCAAWVRNTVDDALAAAELARAKGLNPIVFHARFAQCDRQKIEAEVMELFGPQATPEHRRGRLVIATQVIEQSLDLDFDQLASDLAPIDLLLQRAGRMRRHAWRKRPEGAGEAMLILAPPPAEDAGADWLHPHLTGTGAVYRNHGVLWRTARELERRGRLTVPDDVRELVETVFASDEQDCPEGLIAAMQAAEGEHQASAQIAQNQMLKLNNRYTMDQPYQSELRIRTRIADEQLTIRLAKRDAQGGIIPWAEDDGPEWKRWALSEVRVRPRIAPLDSCSLPELKEDLDPVIARWGRFEQEIPVCVLEPDDEGAWKGGLWHPQRKAIVALRYYPKRGLCLDTR
jgi:CRISPR-associated endonuclease/helicase Cas3